MIDKMRNILPVMISFIVTSALIVGCSLPNDKETKRSDSIPDKSEKKSNFGFTDASQTGVCHAAWQANEDCQIMAAECK